MRLHARAVELPLEGRRPQAFDRVCDILGGSSEHRLHRPEDLEREARKACFAFGERGFGDRGEAARAHRRRAHRLGPELRRLRDGVDHDPFERALAQLAEQKPREKILLGRGRTHEKLREQARPLGGGAFPLGLVEAFERLVDLREREPRRARGRRGERVFHRRIADADPALARVAAEIRRAQSDFGRIEPSQALRERVDFRKAAARPRDALGGGEQFGEQHVQIESVRRMRYTLPP